MSRKLTGRELYERDRKKQLKRDYKFKQVLLSADVSAIKDALDRKRIPYSYDDNEVMRIARWLTSNINDHPVEVVQAALNKYDEYLDMKG